MSSSVSKMERLVLAESLLRKIQKAWRTVAEESRKGWGPGCRRGSEGIQGGGGEGAEPD